MRWKHFDKNFIEFYLFFKALLRFDEFFFEISEILFKNRENNDEEKPV